MANRKAGRCVAGTKARDQKMVLPDQPITQLTSYCSEAARGLEIREHIINTSTTSPATVQDEEEKSVERY
jgi:hypothetical protein